MLTRLMAALVAVSIATAPLAARAADAGASSLTRDEASDLRWSALGRAAKGIGLAGAGIALIPVFEGLAMGAILTGAAGAVAMVALPVIIPAAIAGGVYLLFTAGGDLAKADAAAAGTNTRRSTDTRPVPGAPGTASSGSSGAASAGIAR